MRVLHVLDGLHAGGMETMIMNYYRNIDREKIQFDFLVFSEDSFYDEEVLNLGGKIHRVTPRRANPLRNYRELDVFFKRNTEYNIIHIHQGINYFAPLAKAYKYKIPVRIVHSHGMDPDLIKKQGIFYELFTKKHIDRLGTNFIACSQYAAKQLFTSDRFNTNKYNLLMNAIDLNKFHPDESIRKEVRRELDLEDKFVVGHVGNFTYPKNHKLIIEVFEDLNKKKDDVFLILIGEGSGMSEVKKKVEKSGLSEKVMFMGVRNDVERLLQAFDKFIFPSHYESLGMALIEAQACGVECVVSSTVPVEVEITNLVNFVGLDEPLEVWSEAVKSTSNSYNKNNLDEAVRIGGYDIIENAKWLTNYYKQLFHEI